MTVIAPTLPTPDTPTVVMPKCSVKLERNSRGHNWEITIRDDDPARVLAEIHRLNAEMQQRYGKAD